MSTIYEAMSPGGHETYATSIFSKIKTYLDSNPYGPVKDIPNTPIAIASFDDGSALPMPKLEVAIEPQQGGSGDPSPENVRPISGWSNVNVTVADDIDNPTVENVYTIDLDGTRYGGTLDVVSGVLTVDRAMVTYDGSSDESWLKGNTGARQTWIAQLPYNSNRYADGAMVTNEIPVNASSETTGGNMSCRGTTYTSKNFYIFAPLEMFAELTDLTTWLSNNPLQVCFTLATPITIQLTPTQVNSLLGINNVWADTGDILDAEYIRDKYDNITAKYAAYAYNSGNADTATSATTASKLGTSNVGSATQPIYLNGGTATACTYTLGKSVPSDAVFTDTKNTAGSTDTSSKIFLIGATSQAANPQTYSQDTAYVGTDGCLYSGGTKVLTAHQDISGKADKTATVSTVAWSSNKLTKTINGTTSDVVSASDILDNLTSSQVTTALGYVPGPSYEFESSDDSINISASMVPGSETIDLKLNSVSWNNISGKPSTFPPSSHSHDYLPTGGGTMTGIVYSSYGSASWVNSLTKSSITLTDTIGFGGWICGPTKNGRIAIATHKDGDDVLYIGYGERGRKTNSYTRRAYWNGANGMFVSTVVLGESMLRSSYIGRNDSGDSGYINHVNTGNTAYAPTRASAFTTMSCKHTKTNIVDISEEDALKLLDIRPVNFDYVEEVGGQKDQIGVLAEDTYEILPKVVSVPEDYVEEDFDISKGIHQPLPSVDYAKFVPYLIKMVQIQQKEIDILKKERT